MAMSAWRSRRNLNFQCPRWTALGRWSSSRKESSGRIAQTAWTGPTSYKCVVHIPKAQKLGLIEPIEEAPPRDFSHLIQSMWTANGDSISRQYAGTNALKRDMIRDGGQRKFVGVMKDGYNSASRYYLSQVRDAHRQRVIDTLVAGTDENLGRDPLSQLPSMVEEAIGKTLPTAVFYGEDGDGEEIEEGEDLAGELMEI